MHVFYNMKIWHCNIIFCYVHGCLWTYNYFKRFFFCKFTVENKLYKLSFINFNLWVLNSLWILGLWLVLNAFVHDENLYWHSYRYLIGIEMTLKKDNTIFIGTIRKLLKMFNMYSNICIQIRTEDWLFEFFFLTTY